MNYPGDHVISRWGIAQYAIADRICIHSMGDRSCSDGERVLESKQLAIALTFFQEMSKKWYKHVRWPRLFGRIFKHMGGCFNSDCCESWVVLTSKIKQLSSLPQLTFEFDLNADTSWFGYGIAVPRYEPHHFSETIIGWIMKI